MKVYIALTVLFALLALTEVKPVAGALTEADKEEIVNRHNELRRGVQPTASNMLVMMWNEEAAANAQRWADECPTAHSTPIERKINTSGCGENLFLSSHEKTWTNATQLWYNEVENFQHGNGSVNGEQVGHFTQVVWYNSNQVGCGMAHCPDEHPYKYFYVCQYCPAGNVGGVEEPYKLGSSCGDCPNDCSNKLCTNPCPHINKYSNCPALKEDYTCSHSTVADWCPASCQCATEIF